MKPKPKRTAKLLPEKPAIEILDYCIRTARAMVQYWLNARGTVDSDEGQLIGWMNILCNAASALAPYQSPPWAPMLLPKKAYDKAWERMAILSPEEIRKKIAADFAKSRRKARRKK